MPLTTDAVLAYLSIAVAVMLLIVLYHVIFIVVDLRKITRRAEDVTSQVESVILKPIAVADQILQWLMHQVERKKKRHAHREEEE